MFSAEDVPVAALLAAGHLVAQLWGWFHSVKPTMNEIGDFVHICSRDFT